MPLINMLGILMWVAIFIGVLVMLKMFVTALTPIVVSAYKNIEMTIKNASFERPKKQRIHFKDTIFPTP